VGVISACLLGSHVSNFRGMQTTAPKSVRPTVVPPRGITKSTSAPDPPVRQVGLSRDNAARRRLRRFVFTVNNWTEEELQSIKDFGTTRCRWMICAKETGEGGTSHLQGGALLTSQISFSTLKKFKGFERAHLENMYGRPEDTLSYCSKQDADPFIVGELPSPGIISTPPRLPGIQVNVMICTVL